jgi:hypothetical protein
MYDQAITAGQRARVLATASGDIVLEALVNQQLGIDYQDQGDYHRAIECLRQSVTFFAGMRRHERFGQLLLPAVFSRAKLAGCQAELGLFAEGRALAEEGLLIAETAAHPGSRMYAAWGIGELALRQGDLPRALPLLERALSLCLDMAPGARRLANFIRITAALGAAYTLDGRIAEAELLLTRALEQSVATEGGPSDMRCHLPWGRRKCERAAWRRRTPTPKAPWRSPTSTGNGVTRRMPCALSERSPCIASLQSAIRLKPPTNRPSLSPKSSACARSSPIAIWGWADYICRWSSLNRHALNCSRPSSYTVLWR